MHARYCSPGLGRFLSTDPVGGSRKNPQSWNRYTYVLNNPLRYTDPTGMFPCPGLPSVECDDEITVIGEAPKYNPFTGVQGLNDLIAARISVGSQGQDPPGRRDFALEVISQVARDTAPIATATEIVVDFLVGDSLAEVGLALIPAGRFSSKIIRQMARRGWTKQLIEEAVTQGTKVKAVNKASGNPATRYIHPKTGQSVVIDNITGDVVQVGGPGFKYGPGSGDLP